jgi:oligoendopeptidase F
MTETPAASPDQASGITWDLSDLFAGADDPRLWQTLEDVKRDGQAFAARYRGLVAVPGGPDAATLLAGVQAFEELYERAGRVEAYAHLLYDSDTRDVAARDLSQKVEQRLTELRNLTLFFDLEWLELPDDVAERLIDDPVLAPYAHYLRHERALRPHRLTEAEEKILNEKDVTGKSAWGRLHTELTSALTFPLQHNGQRRDLNLSEALALAYEPERDLRRAAHDTLYAGLAAQGQVLTFIYDTLIQDHLTADRLRQFPSPMASRHVANEVQPEAVETMLQVVEANYGLAQDYFRLKARLLGLDRLTVYDQYAPLETRTSQVSFAEGREIVLDSYGDIDPRFRALAQEFFDRRWIDAEPRQGKRGGAYCASPSPHLHPYVLTSYLGTPRDTMTLAHELGHGLHGMLARKQTLFNYHSTLPLAETASVFGEMMVFDRLVKREADSTARLGLVCQKIEDAFATVFRQNVLTRFEQGAFAAREGARLTPERLGDVWIEANGRYYGDAVQLTDGYRWGWSYIPHFIHSRFYCYAYVFGQLLVLALYRLFQEEGPPFIPRFVTLLEGGGSDTPQRLLAPFGVDLSDAAFWQKGMDELARLVRQAESLATPAGSA